MREVFVIFVKRHFDEKEISDKDDDDVLIFYDRTRRSHSAILFFPLL